MDLKLSQGAISTLMKGGNVEKPILQILGFRSIVDKDGVRRFQLNLSDGLNSITSVLLDRALSDMVVQGTLNTNSVIQVEKLYSNAVAADKCVIIIYDLKVLKRGTEVENHFGDPSQLSEANTSQSGGGSQTSRRLEQAPVKNDCSVTPSILQDQPKSSAIPQTTVDSPLLANRNSMSFGSTSISDCATIPICDITPYNRNCSIKGRVTNKSAIKTWSNSRGDGKLFTIDLLDESGEIKMTGFNNAVDQFYDLIKVNEVYLISKFRAKPANKQWTSFNHDFEISFQNDTQVLPCPESDSQEIPVLSFDFTEIGFIEDMERNKIIDVIGVCKRRGEVLTINTKKEQEISKRDIFLVDKTNTEVRLTLWGKQAQDFDDDTNPVVAVKGVLVGDYDGKNISMLKSSTMLLNPDIPEGEELRKWFDEEGVTKEAKSLCVPKSGSAVGNVQWKLLSEATDQSSSQSGYYFRSKVTVLAVKRENVMYKACTEEKCNKKVIDMGNGFYRCEKCDKENYGFKWRMILNACFGDHSDSLWAAVFHEHGEVILQTESEVLGKCYENDEDRYNLILRNASFTSYIVKFRAKTEFYNNEYRQSYQAVDVQPLNFAEYAQKLVAQIKETIG